MKKQYIEPLCEEMKVSATSELLAGSSTPVGKKSISVVSGDGDVTAE